MTLLNKTDSENAKVMVEHAMIEYATGCKQKETVALLMRPKKRRRFTTASQPR